MLKDAVEAGKREFERSKRHFVRFCMVGVSNGAVDFLIYLILTRVVFEGLGLILVAKALSSIAATVWSFFMNRYITFELKDRWTWKELFRFLLGMGLLLNVVTHYVAVYILKLLDLIALFIAAAATATWGFAFSKYYVFEHHKRDDEGNKRD